MKGCDLELIRKQNKRIKRLEERRRLRKRKYAMIASYIIMYEFRRRKKRNG